MTSAETCSCFGPTLGNATFNKKSVGCDTTNGRYGSVALETCQQCGRVWLTYFVEYEGFRGSGRWFQGLIDPEIIPTITPENAAEIIGNCKHQVAGGSYFDSAGFTRTGPAAIDVDL